jgi:hypothetical protein
MWDETNSFSLKRNITDECSLRGTPHMTKRRKFHSDLSGENVWQDLGSPVSRRVVDDASLKRSPSSRCRPALDRCIEMRVESSLDYLPVQIPPFSIVDNSGCSSAIPHAIAMPPSCPGRVLEHTDMDYVPSSVPEIDPALIESLSLHLVTSAAISTDTDAAAGGGLRRRGVSGSRPRLAYNQHIGQLLCAEAASQSADGDAAATGSPA